MVELFANSGDTDQTLHSATSDLGLHCLQSTLFGVSRLQWVNIVYSTVRKTYLELSKAALNSEVVLLWSGLNCRILLYIYELAVFKSVRVSAVSRQALSLSICGQCISQLGCTSTQSNQASLSVCRTVGYGKCPKILYSKVSDKMAYANSADPDQTAPEGAV